MQTTETVSNKGAADTIPAANMAEDTSGSPSASASSARRISAATARTRGDLEKVLSSSASVTSNKIKTEEELLDYSDLEDDEGCLDSSDNAEKMDTSSNVFEESEADLEEEMQSSRSGDTSSNTTAGENLTSKDDLCERVCLGTGYNTVRAARRAASSQRQLNQFPVCSETTSMGSFEGGGWAGPPVLACP